MEKNKWGIRLILLLLLAWLTYLSSVNSVLAQQNEEGIGEADLFFVEEYMVTAAKRKQTVSESPSAVTVITEEDIRHSGATNVGELLRMVPGFEVVEFTPSDTGIGARGQNKPMSNGILVMVNGRSIYLDFYGTVFWAFTDISLESVKRIEIIRGPGSALYGANAFHGVVNIITKEPEDVQGDNLSLTGGNLNTHINAIHSGKYGELGYLLSAGWEQAFHREDGVSRRYPRERISLDYMLDDDSKIIFEGGIASGKTEAFYDMVGIVDIKLESYNLMLNYQRPRFYLRTFWNRLDAARLYCEEIMGKIPCIESLCIEIDPDYIFDESFVNDIFDIESQYIFDIGGMNSVVTGTSFRYNIVDATLIDKERSQALFAGYLQHEFRFRDLLSSFMGVRYDYHPQVGNVFSPQGSLIISPFQSHILRLSVGMAFRNPSIMESYGDVSIPLTLRDTGDDIGEVHASGGHKELTPEELISYEVGYQTKFLDRVKLNLNLFYNQIKDLVGVGLEYVVLPPESPDVSANTVYKNIYDRDVLGGEAEVELFITEWLKGFLNYAYTEVKDTDTDEIIKMTPKSKINGGIRLALKNGFSSNVIVHYASETDWPPTLQDEIYLPGSEEPIPFEFGTGGEVEPYTIVNLRLGYRFSNDQIEVAASAFNILNDKHKEYPMAEELGTRVVGTVNYKF